MSLDILDNAGEEFYTNAVHYWSEIPATLEGMLGGFGFISQTDIKGSKMLLKQLFNSKEPPGRGYALDCGAGIGRITKFLLTDIFDKVDMVEQNEVFLKQATKYLGAKINKIGNFYPRGLQNFEPEVGKYDVIWVQWVLGHLKNKDLITFLISCGRGLKKNGVIIIKENVTSTDTFEKDEQDSSVTRPLREYHIIFQKAKLHCYRQTKQHNFPKGLFPVYMFIIRPSNSNENDESTVEDKLKSETTMNHEIVPEKSKEIQSFEISTTENNTFEDNVNSIILESSNHTDHEIRISNDLNKENITSHLSSDNEKMSF